MFKTWVTSTRWAEMLVVSAKEYCPLLNLRLDIWCVLNVTLTPIIKCSSSPHTFYIFSRKNALWLNSNPQLYAWTKPELNMFINSQCSGCNLDWYPRRLFNILGLQNTCTGLIRPFWKNISALAIWPYECI